MIKAPVPRDFREFIYRRVVDHGRAGNSSKGQTVLRIITASGELAQSAEAALVKKYGDIDFKTAKIPFAHTEYYGGMGGICSGCCSRSGSSSGVRTSWRSSSSPTGWKRKLSGKDRRIVNIDPGYLTLSNVFLASCKEYFHRAYLREGVYLENEYRFVARHYEPWGLDVSRLQAAEYLDFFHGVRRLYAQQVRK